MKRKMLVSLCILLMSVIFTVSALADTKTVRLGDTGISFEVDSKYDTVTSANKKEYSQQIQSIVTGDNVLLVYSAEYGYYLVCYDQGKDYERFDFANMDSEEIRANYKKYAETELSSLGYSRDYDVSVYGRGKTKWLKFDFSSDHFIFYGTVQGNKSVSVFVYPQTIRNLQDVEKAIDSFTFGSQSFWDKIRSIAGSITGFGRRILGTAGVIIVWSIVGPIALGILWYAIVLIFMLFSLMFGRKRK